MSDGIFGPTLLDICDIYQNPVSIVGIVIVFKAIGSILGASLGLSTRIQFTLKIHTLTRLQILAGLVLDKGSFISKDKGRPKIWIAISAFNVKRYRHFHLTKIAAN